MIITVKKIFFYLIYLLIFLPELYSQDADEILAVRGKIGNEILYQFVGTQEDITAQCVGGYNLFFYSIPFFESDMIPSWTANDQSFNPILPANHEQACETIVAGALPNQMAAADAQFHIKGVIDGQFEYDFTGNFIEVLLLAAQWLAENQIEFAFMITADGWDGNTYSFETPAFWTNESLALIMRAFAIYVEPAKIPSWELY